MDDKEKMEDKAKVTKKVPAKTEAKQTKVIAKESTDKTAVVAQKIERTVTGKVVSNKMDKTITVLVERKVKHPLYGKYINQSNKFHAHDEKNEINEGDVVQITEHKPISKSKSWVVTKVVSKARIET